MKKQKLNIHLNLFTITFIVISIGIIFLRTGTTAYAQEEQLIITPIPSHEHEGDTDEIITTASCQNTGLEKCTCNICGEFFYKTIEKLSHHYTTNTIQATTYNDGSIKQQCDSCGELKQTTTLPRIKTITLSKTTYVYSGKACKPKVTLKDRTGKKIAGNYYKVTYKNNKNPGKAKVIVTLKGNYSGRHTLEFNINLRKTKITSIQGKQTNFTLKWKKAANVNGYEVAYSTSSKMDSAIIKKIKKNKTSLNIDNLTGGINYYVRVRAYKTCSGKKKYSDWSNTKKVFVSPKPWQQMTYQEQVVFLVNKERTSRGLLPLMTDRKLQQATTKRGQELTTVFSHTRPNGTSCFTALSEYKVSYSGAGENIAAGYRSPEAVMEGWMNSPGHRANILNSNYRKIGVSYVTEPSAFYTHYWVQMFTW